MRLTPENCIGRIIGDSVKYRGKNYMVTGNYPRQGYMLMRPTRNNANHKVQSLRLWYENLAAA